MIWFFLPIFNNRITISRWAEKVVLFHVAKINYFWENIEIVFSYMLKHTEQNIFKTY